MIRKLLILFAFLNGAILSAQTLYPVDTIQYNGSSDKLINLVFLPDGYQQAELDQFIIDATSATNTLFTYSPYKEYRDYFNVFAIRVPSVESGIFHPGESADEDFYNIDPNQPVHGEGNELDTAFMLSYDAFGFAHRLLASMDLPAVSTVLMDNIPNYDQAMIIGNAPYFGGSGGEFPTMSTHSQGILVGVHELGHSFVNLKDEYWAGQIFAAEAQNMTQETDTAQVRWKNWLGENNIIHQTYNSPGFETQIAASWYKPGHRTCIMEKLDEAFCSVCKEATVIEIHELVNPILTHSPDDANVISALPTSSLAFNADILEPTPSEFIKKWLLNGVEIASATDSVTVDGSQLAPGTNTLTLEVTDGSSFLRVDGIETTHINSVNWTINCATCVLPNTVIWKETYLSDYDSATQELYSVSPYTTGTFESASIDSIGWVDLEITPASLARTYLGLAKVGSSSSSFLIQILNKTSLFISNGVGGQTRMEDVAVGDVIRIELTATQILFKKNGVTFDTKTRTLNANELGTYRIQGSMNANTRYKLTTSFSQLEDWDPYANATMITNTWKHLNGVGVQGDSLVVQSAPSYVVGTATSANYGTNGKAEIQVPNFGGSVVFGLTKEEFVDHTSDFLYSVIFRAGNFISFTGPNYQHWGQSFDDDDVFAIQYDANNLYLMKNGVSIYSRTRNANEQGDLRIAARASLGTVMKLKTTFTDLENFHDPGNPELVTWHSIGGMNFDSLPNMTVTGPSGYHIGRASSRNTLPAGQDGWVEMTVKQTTGQMRFGLYSKTTLDNHRFRLAGGFAFPEIGNFYEIPQIAYEVGDLLRVERKNNRIYFKKNGAYVFAVDNTITTDADFELHMNDNGMQLDSYSASFLNLVTDPIYTTAPIVWDTTLSNGSKATTQRLVGDGYVEFTAASGGTVWVHLTPDDNLGYSLKASYNVGGGMTYYAPNLQLNYVNVSNTTDVYRIEREGSNIYFKKNGYIVGTGTGDATLDLMPWGSAGISNAVITTGLAPRGQVNEGANGNSLEGLIISPNPSEDMFTITSNKIINGYQLYDVTGKVFKKVSNKESIREEVDIRTLKTGIYFIKIYTSDNEVTIRKIIKK